MRRRGARAWLGLTLVLGACAEPASVPEAWRADADTLVERGADRADAERAERAQAEVLVASEDVQEQAPGELGDGDIAPPSEWDSGRAEAVEPPEGLGPPVTAPEDFGPGFTPLDGIYASSPLLVSFGSDDELPTRTSALFGDLDGDGIDEVVVSGSDEAYAAVDPNWKAVTSLAYRYDADQSALIADESLTMPKGHLLALVDFDGDGRDDMMLQGPSGIQWGGESLANANFLDVAGGQHVLEWRGVSLTDLDGDGLVDLLAQPAYCCTIECPELVVVLATGRRHYTAHPELIETVNHANVCATLVAPVGQSRMMMSFAAIGNCGGMSHVFYEEVGLNAAGLPRFEALNAAGEATTLELALAAPMGGSVADVDGDGDLDLTVTTDPHHALFRAEEDWPLTDMSAWAGIGDAGLILPVEPLAPDRHMIPWGAAFLDLDRDGRQDIVYSHGADPNPGGGKEPKEVGPQHVTAHWNGGGWQFAEITDALGLKSLGEWRALTVGDLDADGDPDLGVGGLGEYPLVFRNDIEAPGHGLSIRLVGTTSNHLGLGALVRVWPTLGGPEQLHVAGHIGNPYGVSEPLIFAGLGEATRAEKVEVTWPSGHVQVVTELAAGALHVIEEPPTITVSPRGRRLDAQGDTPALIEAYARTSTGGIDTTVEVTMQITHGPGTASEATAHQGGWRWEIPPPQEAGTTVIEVKMDGVALKVRPRIFWY